MSIQPYSADELFRKSFERKDPTDDTDFYLRVALSNVRQTAFEDLLIATRNTTFAIKPTWGLSDLRDTISIDGTITRIASVSASDIQETGGEFQLQSSTGVNNVRYVETVDRGQYLAGNEGEAGIAVRIPILPASGSTAYMQWGYYDANNGFGAGVDGTGIFVFRRSSGTDEKIYQSDWNVDTLDGTNGADNASNLTLDFSKGVICKIFFTWYGYGTVRYYFSLADTGGQLGSPFKKIREAHRLNVDGSTSVEDPNQPIRFEIGNGATNTTNYSMFVGGRQFSVIGTSGGAERRVFSENLSQYTISTTANTWVPLVCIRKKATFGPSSRPTSCQINLVGFSFETDEFAEFKVGYRATTSGGTYGAPTDVPAAETGVETKRQSGTTISASDEGIRVLFDSGTGTKQNPTSKEVDEKIALGNEFEIVLFGRRVSSQVTPVVSVQLLWEEEW